MEEQIHYCTLILEKINLITQIQHLPILDNELTRYLDVFQQIQKTPYKSFDEFKTKISKHTIKHLHWAHYNDIESPNLMVLRIFLSELNILYDIINCYNSINNIDSNEGYKILWKKMVDEKYDIICRQFGEGLPCMEGFIDDLLNALQFIKTEPTAPVDIENKIILSKADFANDGGFIGRVIPSLKDWEIIALTLSTFRVALCGTNNSCETDYELVRQSYNLFNYNTYLDYIKLYESYPYITEAIVLSTIEEIGGIQNGVDYIPLGRVCCKTDFITGGKTKRTKRTKRKTNRKTNRNKRKI